MAINNIKPFAVGANANVLSQADYEALPALLSGFQAGKASSAQINKAIRQSSLIAAAVAKFINDNGGYDVLDNGDYATIAANIQNTIAQKYLSRVNPLAELVTDNKQSAARTNLGLGSMATQGAGNVAITGGNATLTNLNAQTGTVTNLTVSGTATVSTFNGQTVNATALNVSNAAAFAGAVSFTGQDYLNKNSVVNVPTDNSNQTFGLRLTGSGGQRSDELFYEKIGTYAARRFIVISGGNTITYDMRQDGSMACLNPVGTWQILPSGEINGPKWGGNLSDFISTWARSNFMTDTRLGSVTTLYKANNTNVFTCPSGYSFSSIDTGDVGTVTATARPIQKQINGNWITVSQL